MSFCSGDRKKHVLDTVKKEDGGKAEPGNLQNVSLGFVFQAIPLCTSQVDIRHKI